MDQPKNHLSFEDKFGSPDYPMRPSNSSRDNFRNRDDRLDPETLKSYHSVIQDLKRSLLSPLPLTVYSSSSPSSAPSITLDLENVEATRKVSRSLAAFEELDIEEMTEETDWMVTRSSYNYPPSIQRVDQIIHPPKPMLTDTSNPESLEVISIFEEIIWTPFYRTYRSYQDQAGSCGADPNQNYGPYNLFCLKTKLQSWVNRKIDPGYLVHFESYPKEDKIYQIVVLNYGGDHSRLSIDQIRSTQEQVNWLTRDFSSLEKVQWISSSSGALLISYDSFTRERSPDPVGIESGSKYYGSDEQVYHLESSWLRQMIPFVNPHPFLYPYVNDEGLIVDLSGIEDIIQDPKGVDVNTRDGSVSGTYQAFHTQLQNNTYDTLVEMYDQGWVYRPPSEVVSDWLLTNSRSDELTNRKKLLNYSDESIAFADRELVPTPSQELYRPIWAPSRLSRAYNGNYGLFQSLSNGNSSFDLEIGTNDYLRHSLSYYALNDGYDLIFIGPLARFSRKNQNITLGDSLDIQQALDEIVYSSFGQVITIRASRVAWIEIYMDIVLSSPDQKEELPPYSNPISYRVNNMEYPYVFSVEIPLTADLEQYLDTYMGLVSDYLKVRIE